MQTAVKAVNMNNQILQMILITLGFYAITEYFRHMSKLMQISPRYFGSYVKIFKYFFILIWPYCRN